MALFEKKHLCRICRKGFGCGRALGGHMRAHGIGTDDDDDEEENKHTYELRANPNNRLHTWKCVSDDGDSLLSSSPAESRGGNWSKRKKVGPEEEDLANCLMMLSNATAEPEESCASASRDDSAAKAKAKAKGLFQCKACKKVFNSHQALGGHRASHKKVKGCFAARLDHQTLILTPTPHDTSSDFPATLMAFDNINKRKSKVHECSICHRKFSSGQALGGHKRCHWITSNSAAVGPGAALANFQQSIEQINLAAQHRQALDLNLPAGAAPEDAGVSMEIFLQPWVAGSSSGAKREDGHDRDRGGDLDILRRSDDAINVVDEGDRCNKNSNADVSVSAVIEAEADSKVKLAKLSELKDMNANEGSSPWLQVGIGSTTDVGSTVP